MLDDRPEAPDLPELPWQLSLGLVLVDEKPTLFALYHRGEQGASGHVAAWVVALPDGAAVILPIDRTGSHARPVMTTLQNVRRRWCRLLEAELVQVAGRQALHLAA